MNHQPCRRRQVPSPRPVVDALPLRCSCLQWRLWRQSTRWQTSCRVGRCGWGLKSGSSGMHCPHIRRTACKAHPCHLILLLSAGQADTFSTLGLPQWLIQWVRCPGKLACGGGLAQHLSGWAPLHRQLPPTLDCCRSLHVDRDIRATCWSSFWPWECVSGGLHLGSGALQVPGAARWPTTRGSPSQQWLPRTPQAAVHGWAGQQAHDALWPTPASPPSHHMMPPGRPSADGCGYLGWRIRLSDSAEEVAVAQDLHPKVPPALPACPPASLPACLPACQPASLPACLFVPLRWQHRCLTGPAAHPPASAPSRCSWPLA